MALSAKQKAFINEYLIDGNATRAAERAGYKGDENTLAVTGYDNLRNPKIAEAISQRTAESAMSGDEVLGRLAEQARGTIADFVTFDAQGNPGFDLQSAAVLGKMGLVKKLKIKTRTYTTPAVTVAPAEDAQAEGEVEVENVEVTETTVEFELHDAQAALVQIGKHHRLFVDGPTGDANDPIYIKLDR